MTYEKLYLTALSELQNGKISYPEYEQMIEPLKEEIKVPADGKKIEPLNYKKIRADEGRKFAEWLEKYVDFDDDGLFLEGRIYPNFISLLSEYEKEQRND